MKKFKNILFSAIAVSMLFVGCDEKEDEGGGGLKSGGFNDQIVATVDTYGVEVTSVTATVVRDYGDDSYEVARGEYKNGGFTLNLPTTLPNQYLIPLWNEEILTGVTVSDTDVKGNGLDEIKAYAGAYEVGRFFEYARENVMAQFIYVDRDVSIIGTYTEKYEGFTMTEKYSLFLQEGWNKMYIKQAISGEDMDIEVEAEFTTEVINGLAWYFDGVYDYYAPGNQTKATKAVEKLRAFSLFR